MHDKDPLEYDCLHCALSAFINEWRAKWGDKEPAEILGLLLETAADVVVTQENPTIQQDLRTRAMLQIVSDMTDIKNGEYKVDFLVKNAGRLQ